MEEKIGCFALIVLCLVTVNVLWLFLRVPWVVMQCVTVVSPDHTHLLLYRCTAVYIENIQTHVLLNLLDEVGK